MNALDLKGLISEAVRHAVNEDSCPTIHWNVPKNSDQGDLSTNIAMLLTKLLKKPPRVIAEDLVNKVDWKTLGIDKVEIAGPGFINLFVGNSHYHSIVRNILEQGSEYGKSDSGAGKRVIIEFVSANPTGPLNVVSARAAAIGDSLVRVMRKAGYEVAAEFYINDAGRQVRRLGASVIARGQGKDVPEDGYHGDDVKLLAEKIFGSESVPDTLDPDDIGRKAADINVLKQQEVLDSYGVQFDRWCRESELHSDNAPFKTLDKLKAKDAVFIQEDATWFKGSAFGDEDRVIVTSEGRPTYLLPDIAYHLTKADRGFDKAIDLLGPDHHDYVGRMKAALKALGYEDFLEALIVQQVSLIEGGEKIKMSKRAGKLVTLEDLLKEVGKDVTRYFFLQRKTSSPLEFDLDLAKEQSDQNPVFYIQYAHTRICGILRQSGCPVPSSETDLTPLEAPAEIELIKHLEQFGQFIARAADSNEPQRVVNYLDELAAKFHKFYSSCKVVGVDMKVSEARAALVQSVKIALAEGLNLLGVSAPERM
jgi:arginyl-tRNA synthetase